MQCVKNSTVLNIAKVLSFPSKHRFIWDGAIQWRLPLFLFPEQPVFQSKSKESKSCLGQGAGIEKTHAVSWIHFSFQTPFPLGFCHRVGEPKGEATSGRVSHICHLWESPWSYWKRLPKPSQQPPPTPGMCKGQTEGHIFKVFLKNSQLALREILK